MCSFIYTSRKRAPSRASESRAIWNFQWYCLRIYTDTKGRWNLNDETFGTWSPQAAASVHTSRAAFSRKDRKLIGLSSKELARWYKVHGTPTRHDIAETGLAASMVFAKTIVCLGTSLAWRTSLFKPYVTAFRRVSICISAVTSVHLRSFFSASVSSWHVFH